MPPQKIKLVSFGMLGRAGLDRLLFGRQEFDLESGDDGLRDLVLQREDVVQVAVVALRPDVIARRAHRSTAR